MKVLSKGIIIVTIFFRVYMMLTQSKFVKHLRVEAAKTDMEKSVGDII